MQIVIGLIYLLIYTAFLIPREFNVRLPGIAFSVADIVFFALVSAWLIVMTRRRLWRELFSSAATRLVVGFLCFLAFIAIVHLSTFGWGYKYFYIRYLYAFGTVAVFLIGYSVRAEALAPRMMMHLFLCYLLLSAVSIGYMEMPALREFYVEQFVRAKLTAQKIGYGMAYEGGYQLGTPRPMDLVGGFGNLVAPGILFVPLFMALLPVLRQKLRPAIVYGSYIVIFAALFYLMAKATFIGVAISTGVLLFYVRANMKAVLITGSLLLALMFSVGVAQKTWNRFAALSSDTSTGSRVVIYSEAAKRIAAHPFAGIGLGGSMEDIKHPSIFSRVDIVDSLYLMPALKMGIPGMLFITGLLGFLWYRGVKYLRAASPGQGFEYRFAAGMTAVFPGFFVAGLFVYPFSSISFCLVFWLMLGMYGRVVESK